MKLSMTAVIVSFAMAMTLRTHAEQIDTDTIEQHIQHQAKVLGGKESGQRQLSKPFDFDGLRESDIAVVYWISTGNDATAFLAIFESNKQSWILTHQVRLGGRGLRHITGVSFSKQLVSIDCLEFAGDEPLSSPSLRVTITASVDKGLLNLKREVQNN